MNFNRLLEVRSTSLSKLSSLNFSDAASEYPTETLRIFFNLIEKEGIALDKSSKQEAIEEINTYLQAPGRGSPWFDQNKLKFDLKSGTFNLKFRFLINKNRLYWDFNLEPFGGIRTNLNNNIPLKSKTVEDVFSEIVSFVKDAINIDPKDYDKQVDHSKSLLPKAKNIEKNIEIISKKFGFMFESEEKDNIITMKITPWFNLIGVDENLFQGIHSRISWEIREKLKSFNFKFQVERAKKMFDVIVDRIEKSEYYILDSGFGSSEYIYIEIGIFNPDKKSRVRSSMSIKDAHEASIEWTRTQLDSMYKKASDETKSDIRKKMVKDLFKRVED